MTYREKRVILGKAVKEWEFEGIFPDIEISMGLLDGCHVDGVVHSIMDMIDAESRQQDSLVMIVNDGRSQGILVSEIDTISTDDVV